MITSPSPLAHQGSSKFRWCTAVLSFPAVLEGEEIIALDTVMVEDKKGRGSMSEGGLME